jgi:hypothetical protein
MKNPVTRSTLFLTELILDLFIFIVCTAVCVGLFLKASGMSRDSGDLTRASTWPRPPPSSSGPAGIPRRSRRTA